MADCQIPNLGQDWRQKFGTPAQELDEVLVVIDHQQQQEDHQPVQQPVEDEQLLLPINAQVLENDDEMDGEDLHRRPHRHTSRRTAVITAGASRDPSPGPPSRAASLGPPSRAASPSRADSPGPASRAPSPVEGDEVAWEKEKQEEMRLLFPEYSPDWMKEIIQGGCLV